MTKHLFLFFNPPGGKKILQTKILIENIMIFTDNKL